MTIVLIVIGVLEAAILAVTIWSTRRAFERRRYARDFPNAL